MAKTKKEKKAKKIINPIKRVYNEIAKVYKEKKGYLEEVRFPLDFIEFKDNAGNKRDLGYIDIKYKNGKITFYKFNKPVNNFTSLEKRILLDINTQKAIIDALYEEHSRFACALRNSVNKVIAYLELI